MSRAAQAVQRAVNEIREKSRAGGEVAKPKRERRPKKTPAASVSQEETPKVPKDPKKPKYRQLAINTEGARNVVLKGLQAIKGTLEGLELQIADGLIRRIEARKGMD